ncbi:MAG: PD40 domain-containing protein [Candidatus Marinimicrobia bacterium]|nr:PD40 domain-containing protein [Candidatus Neomarinimicrobiota bacterium]
MRSSLLIILIIIISTSLEAQYFGKNKVTYEQFQWKILQTSHFDIYFYEGGENLAHFAAKIAEEAYDDYSTILRWKINKRIVLIIYNSHSDFQQTNVTLETLTEGIAGFTELFKNRAVVAYDGSYDNFRHVIRHELVHVFINDLIYGGNISSVVSGAVTLNIPLWMHEGLAEFISIGWDDKADLILRDLVINKQVPRFSNLNGYMAYKGGQSFYYFVTERYGLEKIGELWSNMKGKKSVSRGIKTTFGIEPVKLEEKWQKWLKKKFWPDYQDRSDIEDIAKKLTDHEKVNSYYNVSPAISPNGNMIAFMSDRDGYADIFLISALDGKMLKKLVKGQRTPELEELKWLNPKLSWSPDNKKIVLAVKSKFHDALLFVDVKTGKQEKVTFDEVDEIYTADWSPDGENIAFIGLKNDRTDLYIYSIKDKKLIRLTNDQFSDFEPSWSPDGKKIAFVSQRGLSTDTIKYDNGNVDFNSFNYAEKDIFIYDLVTKKVERVTDTPWDEESPIWANTKNAIIYTSNYNGISNIFVINLDTKEKKAITNVSTGIYQISISDDDTKLSFAGYCDFGWDIYIYSNPLDKPDVKEKIKPTIFAKEFLKDTDKNIRYYPIFKPSKKKTELSKTKIIKRGKDFSRYIFAPGYENWQIPQRQDSIYNKQSEGEISQDSVRIKEYKTKFTLDLVYSYFSYSSLWGYNGIAVFVISDILGNNRITIATENNINLKNSDYYIAYDYLAKRTDYSFLIFNNADFISVSSYSLPEPLLYRFRNYGGYIAAIYPKSIYERIEISVLSYNVKAEGFGYFTGQKYYEYNINTILPGINWVYDNSLWSYFYPIDGWRIWVGLITSPKYKNTSLSFTTVKADIRKYFKTSFEYSFGIRLSMGMSNGENPQRFFVGGEENWMNYRLSRRHNYGNLSDLYFSEFITPLRGARYYEREGTRFFLINAEFRYPFIKYLSLGWPLPMTMGGIHGVTFLDIGSAWYGNDFHPFGKDTYRGYYMDDLVMGTGFGTRIYVGIALLKIDVAWRYDLDRWYKPLWMFSLGVDW